MSCFVDLWAAFAQCVVVGGDTNTRDAKIYAAKLQRNARLEYGHQQTDDQTEHDSCD